MMKLNLRINGKMILYILGTTIVVYVSALGYAALKLRSDSYKNAHKILEANTSEIIIDAQKKLDTYIAPLNVLANTVSNLPEIAEPDRREYLSKLLYGLLDKNPDYSSVWAIMEPMSIDALDASYANTLGSTVVGNFNYNYYRRNESIVLNTYIEANYSKVYDFDFYKQARATKKIVITEPSNYSYTSNKTDNQLISKAVAPIIIDGTFYGVVGVDLPLSYMQQTFSKTKPMDKGRTYIITNTGVFLAHPNTEFHGKLFEEYAPTINNEFKVTQTVKNGEKAEFVTNEPNLGKSIFKIQPLTIGESETAWALCVVIPIDILYKKANRTFYFALFIGLIGIVILSLIISGIAKSISIPIKKTTMVLEEISRGNIKKAENIKFLFNDEINDMAIGMNKVVEGLNSAALFAQKIGEGHLNIDYKLLSESDALGASLISMQQSLVASKSAEQEKRIEDEKRNWVTHGLAKFGEVIRQHNDDMDKFTMNIIQNIVEYMECAQVAMYINQQIEDEEQGNELFELKAVMAYGKPVMLNKTFEKGKELLGRVASENKTLYLENLPERYVLLSPGIHQKTKPNNLLIASLHLNENTLGVIEILSYNKLEPYQIDFVEKLCENIASVVASVKTNLRTEKLLAQSQQQADELAQHEEEMRQNLEEMEATQEEANKRQNELNSYIKALRGSIMSAELDINGRVIDISPIMSSIYGASTENMRGKYYDAFVVNDKNAQDEFTEFWDNLIKTGHGKRKQKILNRSRETWLLESYVVIKADGLSPRILVVAVDKTKEKELNDLLQSELKNHNMV